MADPGLTPTQLRVLRYVRGFHARHGYYATVRDIQKHMGWRSPSTAFECLYRLEQKGRMKKQQVTRDRHVYVTVE